MVYYVVEVTYKCVKCINVLLIVPKYFGARLFYSLYAQTLRIF